MPYDTGYIAFSKNRKVSKSREEGESESSNVWLVSGIEE